MKESNAAIVQENNMFENYDPKEFQFLTILAFLPFSRFLISYFMKQSNSITLSQCKKIVGIYTGITVLLFTIIFFIAKAFVPSFDFLKTQIDQNIQITVGDSQSLVPDSVEKIEDITITDPKVVAVDEKGKAKAGVPGEAAITFRIGEHKYKVYVKVKEKPKKKKKKKGKK